jgi:hypothetical protein
MKYGPGQHRFTLYSSATGHNILNRCNYITGRSKEDIEALRASAQHEGPVWRVVRVTMILLAVVTIGGGWTASAG